MGSAFDEEDIVEEPKQDAVASKASAFDAEDVVVGDEELANEQFSVEKVLPTSVSGIAGGGVGGVAGFTAGQLAKDSIAKGASKLMGKSVDVGLSVIGNLDGDQLGHIRSTPSYGAARMPDEVLEDIRKVGEEVSITRDGAGKHITRNLQKTAEDVNEAGYNLHKKALDTLPNGVDMPAESYRRGIVNGLNKDQSAFKELTPADQAQFKQENYIEPLKQHKEGLAKQSRQLQAEVEMLKSKLDPNNLESYIKLNNEIKAKEAMLKNLPNSVADQASKLNEAMTTKYQKQVVGIPQELLDLEPSLQNKSLLDPYRKIVDKAVSYSTQPGTLKGSTVGGDAGLIKILRQDANFDSNGAGPVERIATNISESVKDEYGKINTEFGDLQKQSSRAIKAKEALNASGIKINEQGDIILKSGAAAKMEDIFAYPNRYPDEYKQIQEALDQTKMDSKGNIQKYVHDPKLSEIENIKNAQSIADKHIYSNNQPLDFVQERLQQADRVSTELEKFGFKVDKDGKVSVADSTKAVKYASEPKLNKLAELENLLDEANKLSSNQNAKSGKEIVGELQSGVIKDQIAKAGDISQRVKNRILPAGGKTALGALIGGSATNSGQGAVVGGAVMGAADIFGTQIQEKLAKTAGAAADSKLLKAAGFLGKEAIPYLGGAAAGYAGYTAAKDFFPEAQAATIGTLDAVNPVPFTDVAAGAIAGKKEIDQSVSEGKSPMLEEAGVDELGMPIIKSEMSDDVNSAMLQGAISPITQGVPALAGMAVEAVDQFGTSRSLDARARMEQTHQKLQDMRKNSPKLFSKEPEQNHGNFKSFVEQSPDALRQLADQLSALPDKAAASFAGPLARAADAEDPKSRSAILFGLYQQPAFRQLHKKKTEQE